MTERLSLGADVILVGAGAFAEEVADLASDAGVTVRAMIEGIDRTKASSGPVPILWVDDQASFRPDLPIAPAIGSPRRATLIDRLVGAGRSLGTLVHPSAVISRSAVIGPGCVIFPNVVVGAQTMIGRGTIVNRGALIGHHTTIGRDCFLGPGANVAGKVTIGDRVQIALAAVVRDAIQVGDDAIVGAGGVAVRDVAARTTVVGLPAREMNRDR